MKRIIAGLLLAVMLFTCTACPASSGGPGTGNTETGATFIDSIPEEYNGYFAGEEFVVSVSANYLYEIYAEEDSTETVDQLVYKRNSALETRFGCKIVPEITAVTGKLDLASHYDYVSETLLRGQAENFDAILMMAYMNGSQILAGNYLDWRDEDLFPYSGASIKAHKEWWPEHMNTNSTVAGHQYVAISDLCLTAMENSYGVIFNKDLEKEYNVATTQFGASVETLYEAVDLGEWTLDAFYEIVKDFYIPSATGTPAADEDDIYGLAAGRGTDADAWAYALGFNYLTNDGENYPELWNVNMNVANAISTLRSIYDSSSTYAVFGDDYISRTQFFVDGHALFNLSSLEQLKDSQFHDMESDYGVLPYPKLNTNQKEYLTGSMDHYSCIAVPYFKDPGYGSNKIEMIDVMIEALSAESCDDVKTSYYEAIMKYNSTRDEDSVRMIDKIMDGRVYDLGMYHYTELDASPNNGTNGDDGLALFFRRMLSQNNTTDPATQWNDKERSVLVNQLSGLIERYMFMFG